jgi:hypothetical protein
MTLSTSSSRAIRTSTGAFEPAARSRRSTSNPSIPAGGRQARGRRLAGGELEALLAGSRDHDLVTLLLEGELDAAGDRELVLDDQDGGCRP